MQIGVVGARGFIGSRLLAALGGHGSAVAVERSSFLTPLDRFPGVLAANPLAQCSVAYFLVDAAGPAVTGHSVATRNLLTFESFLRYAARARVRKVILVSSGGAVYGEPDYLPIDEQHPRRPVSDYGRMMLALEGLLEGMALTTGCTAIILRLSNVYGRVGHIHVNQGVVEHFARSIRAGHPMRVQGSVDNLRDYIHIDDCVRALSLVAERIEESAILNVGTGIGTSVRELGHMMARAHGVKPCFLEVLDDSDRVSRNILNVKKAARVLGWCAGISLQAGIESLVETFNLPMDYS